MYCETEGSHWNGTIELPRLSPSDVPWLTATLQVRPVLTHAENFSQALELGSVREELAALLIIVEDWTVFGIYLFEESK